MVLGWKCRGCGGEPSLSLAPAFPTPGILLELSGSADGGVVELDRWWSMGKAKIVNAGVDTLVLNAFYRDERGRPIKHELDTSLRLQMDTWKRAAQEGHEEFPTTLVFNGAVLHIFSNGAGQGQWPWMLKTSDITL